MCVHGCPLFLRKQDFRELKQLQREEMKEATEFYAKIKVDREVQDKKFEIESTVSSHPWLLSRLETLCLKYFRIWRNATRVN